MTDAEWEEIKALVMEMIRVMSDAAKRQQRPFTEAEVVSLERAYDYDND